MQRLEFDLNGYNSKYNVYKSYYHASKMIKQPEYFIDGPNCVIHVKSTVKVVRIDGRPFYEIIGLRSFITTK